MEIIYQIFGEGKDLSVVQMCCRAAVVYLVILVLIRVSGRRTFGKKSAFDNTIILLLGALLSRAVVGASAFAPTVASSFILVMMHRCLAWLSIKNGYIRKLVKGDNYLLFKNGELLQDNLSKGLMDEHDLMGDVRVKGNTDTLDTIKEIHMECTGEVSVVKKS